MHHSIHAKVAVSLLFSVETVFVLELNLFGGGFVLVFFSGETIAVVYEHTKRTHEILFADWE